MKITLLAVVGCAAVAIAALAAQNRQPESAAPLSPVAAALDADHDGNQYQPASGRGRGGRR